ncbi:hypothetical protein FQ087_03280 [Sporosarcina sp. ANT_H38]|uniref:VanW family protein n=1 Tax=Sporosarcina sp. ANT_H38 TaxID=2597358 RepID=UPI0011F29059|nr:VanW family protein [Sporosarcina sp. ANT_H38]KAA0965344.1 hypothetical protein FQ087_03280 [Sporosarcina sp. ANT_H38]
MRSKGFLNTFIIVLSSTLVFYGFSSVGALAFTNVSSKDFGDETFVGPFDISRQKEQAVKEQLRTDFITLQTDFAVDLTYQDITVAMPVEVVTFDVEKTVEQSNSGKENPIVASVSVDGLRTILTQQFSSILFTEDSIQSIATGIERKLETGIMPLNVHITDYSDFTEKEIATSSIAVTEPSTSFMNLINALNGTEITSFATFSLFDFIKNNEVGLVSDEELTVLASVLYATILQTNFVIDERNIGSILAPLAEPGFEAAINEQLGLNFIFTNPNKTAFRLHIQSDKGKIVSSIIGMPLLYSYSPFVGQLESFEPKTIQQFSAFVPDGQVRVADEGRKGMEVEVHRTISYEGSVVEDEMISSDFYAPIPKIELHPLKKDSQQTSESSNGGTVDLQDNQNSADSQNVLESNDDKDPSPLKGEDEKEVQYDKGGNIIE